MCGDAPASHSATRALAEAQARAHDGRVEPFRDDLRAAHEKVARLEEQNEELAGRVRAAEAEARRARAAAGQPVARSAGASVTFTVIAVVALAGVGAAAAVSMLLARRPAAAPAITVVTVPASVAPAPMLPPVAASAERTPADAERTIAAVRPRFRACYDKGLAVDPSMTGSMTVVLAVDADGTVTAAHAEEESGLSSQVRDCIVESARGAHFAPSTTGQATTVRVPVRFVQAR